MLEMNYISKEDKNLFIVTDSVEEAVDYIYKNAVKPNIIK
jgi:predicted Rossmann-fold nucleotide-binding protein